MAPSTSRPPKGKQADQTGPWSKSKWDEERQFWYNDRIGPSGEIEYHYHEASPTTNDPSVPRANVGFGTQDTSTSTLYQNPSSYQSSRTSGTAYPPVGESYTTSTGGASWPGSNSAYSPAYPAQTSPVDTSTGNYGGSIGSSSTPYPPLGSSQYGSESTLTRYGSTNDTYATNATSNYYSPPDSGQGGLQELTSDLSGMTLGPIAEGESSSQMPVPTPIYRAPGPKTYETLDPRYCQVPEKGQRNFWRVGRVFMMLWTEPAGPQVPAGGGTLPNGSHISTTWLGEKAYSEIRRLVVIQEGYGNSICSPIQTYSGQATLKPNLPDRQQHAIIYTSKHCPDEYWYTAQDGTVIKEALSKDPIKVRREQDGPEGDLGKLSRINYSKIYTVENYVRVLNIGMVDRDSLPSLERNSMIYRATPAEKPVRHASRSNSTHHRSSKGGKGKDKKR